MKQTNKSRCAMVVSTLMMGIMFTWSTPVHASQKMPPKTRKTKKTKSASALKREQYNREPHETIILPVRYTRGSRMVRLLKMFVPYEADHRVHLRYSPSLHKILIRGPVSVLRSMSKACKKLDQPQTQFRVQFYFMRLLEAGKGAAFQKQHPGLYQYLKRAYPLKQSFALTNHLYIRVSNHEKAQIKSTSGPKTRHPSIKLVLHQAPSPKALIALQMELAQHERFTSTSRRGTNTMFISSVQLKTKLFVRSGQWTLAGHAPLAGKAREDRALVVVKIDRISETQSTKKRAGVLAPSIKQGIANTMRQNIKRLKRCYRLTSGMKPRPEGRVLVGLQIGPKGRTSNVKIQQSTLKHQGTERCLIAQLKAIRFPYPPGGGTIKIKYPIRFAAGR